MWTVEAEAAAATKIVINSNYFHKGKEVPDVSSPTTTTNLTAAPARPQT